MSETRVQTVLLAVACVLLGVQLAVRAKPADAPASGLDPSQMAQTFVSDEGGAAMAKLNQLGLDGFRIHAVIPTSGGTLLYGNYPAGRRPQHGEGVSHNWSHLE